MKKGINMNNVLRLIRVMSVLGLVMGNGLTSVECAEVLNSSAFESKITQRNEVILDSEVVGVTECVLINNGRASNAYFTLTEKITMRVFVLHDDKIISDDLIEQLSAQTLSGGYHRLSRAALENCNKKREKYIQLLRF
jgi:hypothetical protein